MVGLIKRVICCIGLEPFKGQTSYEELYMSGNENMVNHYY